MIFNSAAALELSAAAIAGSAFIAAAHLDGGLVGLARAIRFVQDVVIAPAWQRRGIRRALVKAVLERYALSSRTGTGG